MSPDSQTGIAVTAAAATHFSVTGYPGSTVAGVSHSVTVTALDAFDNVATGYAGTVHFTSTDVAATLPTDSTLTAGTGSFSATLQTAGSRSIIATDTVTSAITGAQTGITVTAAAATHLSVTGYPSSATAGVAHSVTVTALDAFDNVATGYAGLVTVTATGGTTHVSPAAATALTDGVGTYGVTFDTPGTGRQITASGSLGVSPDSQTGIAVTAAAAPHISVTG